MTTVHYGHTESLDTFIITRYIPSLILGLENVSDVDFDNNIDNNVNVLDESWIYYKDMV